MAYFTMTSNSVFYDFLVVFIGPLYHFYRAFPRICRIYIPRDEVWFVRLVFKFWCYCDVMDGWPAIETDAGRAVMKTPATKAKDLFKVVLPHSLIPWLSTITWQRSTRNDLHALYNYAQLAHYIFFHMFCRSKPLVSVLMCLNFSLKGFMI